MFVEFLFELGTLPLLVITCLSVVGIARFRKQFTEQLSSQEANESYPFSHYYAAYRGALLSAFKWILHRLSIRSYQALCVVVLLVPLLTWNHFAARAVLADIFAEKWDVDSDRNTAFGKTIFTPS